MEDVKVIEEKYTGMALELASLGIETNEILERIENIKNIERTISVSKNYRNALRIKKNNRVGYIAYK